MQYFNQTLLQNLFKNFKRPLYHGGAQELPNNVYLTTDFFPAGIVAANKLYAIHNNGTGAWSGTAWVGGVNGTQIGSFSSTTDHLGNTAFCGGNGSQAISIPGTSIAVGTNLNFSSGCRMKITDLSASRYIVNKRSGTGSEDSFVAYVGTDKRIFFGVWNTSLAQNYIYSIPVSADDGNYHDYQVAYKYVSASEAYLLISFDGTIVGYTRIGSAATRNDSTNSNIVFGGNAYTGAGNVYGGMSDCWFAQDATYGFLEPNDMRKVCAAGCRKLATVDATGIVKIDGKASVRIKIIPPDVTGITNSTAPGDTVWTQYLPENGLYSISSGTLAKMASTGGYCEAYLSMLNGAAYIGSSDYTDSIYNWPTSNNFNAFITLTSLNVYVSKAVPIYLKAAVGYASTSINPAKMEANFIKD